MENKIELLANSIVSASSNSSGGFGAFAVLKPLQEAIESNPAFGGVISETTNTILGIFDIVIICGMVATVIFAIWGFVRFYFKYFRANDETVDYKAAEAKKKKELKNTIIAVSGLTIIFILLPIIVMVIGFILQGAWGA